MALKCFNVPRPPGGETAYEVKKSKTTLGTEVFLGKLPHCLLKMHPMRGLQVCGVKPIVFLLKQKMRSHSFRMVTLLQLTTGNANSKKDRKLFITCFCGDSSFCR